MKKCINIFPIIFFLFPFIVSAQSNGIRGLIQATGFLITLLIPVVVGFALLSFFWGLVKFIFRVGGDEKAVEEGKRIMLWGIGALFVMLSIWGLVSFLRSNLGIPGATL